MFYYDGAGMWVDSEGSAWGFDTSCVRVLLPRDHGPECSVGVVPRYCWCCGVGRTLPAPCPWSPREEPAWISPTPGLGAGRGAPPAPGHHQNPAFAPASVSSRQDPGGAAVFRLPVLLQHQPWARYQSCVRAALGGWGLGQPGAAGAAAGGCGGCSCLWLRQRLRHTLVQHDTETFHHGLLFKQDEGFYFFSLSLRIPYGFQR